MTRKPEPKKSKVPLSGVRLSPERILLWSLLAAGAILRIWYIHWSLPDLFEEATPLVKSWGMWNWGGSGFEFNPHFFNYPALTFYLNFLCQSVQFLLGFAVGVYKNLGAYGADMTTIVIPSRLLSVAFDVGTIWLLALAVREHVGERASLIAAALIALNPLHIEQAHYITVDTPLTFFVTLSLLFMLRIFRGEGKRAYLYAGIAIGLAGATKYTGIILVPVLVVVHMMRGADLAAAVRSLRLPRVWLSVALAAIVFCAINPYIFLSYDEFIRDFSFEQFHIAYGHLGLDPDQSTVVYYLVEILPGIFGWPLLAIVIGTLGALLVRRPKHLLPLAVFPVIYLLMISSWEMRAPRYSLPVVPSLLAVGALGTFWCWEQAVAFMQRLRNGKSIPPDSPRVAAIILALILLGQPLAAAYAVERSFMSTDTRTVAREWIQRRVKPGAAIATGPFGISLSDTAYRVITIPFLAEESQRVAPFYDPRWYEDFDLLIASDFDEARYRRDPARFAEFFPYYDTLRTHWQKVFEVAPVPNQPGPTLWYFVPPANQQRTMFDTSLFTRLAGVPESVKTSTFLRELTIVLIQKGRFAKAEQVLENIVSVEPENLAARFTLARIHLTLGNNAAALKEIQYIAYRDQSMPEVYVFAGDVLMNLGRGEEAEKSFWKALSLNDRFEAAYEDLIVYYTRSNAKTKLLATLKRYRAILPQGGERANDIDEQIGQLERKR